MKNALLTVLILLACWSYGQNLVPNGSFETIDPNPSYGCPNGNCCPAADAFSDGGKPQYWENIWPDNGQNDVTGDYYNPCASQYTYLANYPGSNQVGCQLPLDGQSYYGFVAANLNNFPLSNEFVMNKSIPLVGGQQYYVEFYVVNAAGNDAYGWPSNSYVKNIGAYFISNSANLPATLSGINNLTPQIPNSPPSGFYNSSGWQKISGYFTPASSGNWTMVIGNFDPGMATFQQWCQTTEQITTPTLSLKSSNLPTCAGSPPCSSGNLSGCDAYVMSYYFVDGVSILPANQTPPTYDPYVSPAVAVCTASKNYTLENVPFGSTVSWSVSPTNLFSGATSGSGAIANLTAATGVSGSSTITYTMSSACGQTQLPATGLYVGLPGPIGSLNKNINNPPFCVGATVIASIETVPGAVDYTWVSNNPSMLEVSGDYTSLNLLADEPGTCTFSITVSNYCGTQSKNFFANIQDCSGGGGGGGLKMASYPNPTSSSLTVQVTDATSANSNSTELDQPYQVYLVDRFSKKVVSVKSKDKLLAIPVDGLPPGIYYLNLIYKDAVLQKQVVIQK